MQKTPLQMCHLIPWHVGKCSHMLWRSERRIYASNICMSKVSSRIRLRRLGCCGEEHDLFVHVQQTMPTSNCKDHAAVVAKVILIHLGYALTP